LYIKCKLLKDKNKILVKNIYDYDGNLLHSIDVKSLRRFDFTDIEMDGADLDEDLTGSNFSDSSCLDVDFGNSNLTNVTFDFANITSSIFTKAILHKTTFENVVGANCNFSGCDLTRDISFENAELVLCNFNGADLRGTNFKGANLYGADLRGANVEGADFTDANLKSAKTDF
tara:strand:- start:88 stop:606 length:519 start_codon:yes stop_codon:yes gene_type:complete